ncbi:MAG TPA: co-chaperone GroES [Firmicutes bacterium]|nr:co-chaperone GroES [Bacillota bacterium]
MIKPLRDYVLLEVEPKEKVVGGFIIPESKEKPSTAKVVAVGPGKEVDGKLVSIPVKVGDKVVFKEYSTTEYKDGDKKYLLIKAEDLLAIVE